MAKQSRKSQKSSKIKLQINKLSFILVSLLILTIIYCLLTVTDLFQQSLVNSSKLHSLLPIQKQSVSVFENAGEGYTFFYPSDWSTTVNGEIVEVTKPNQKGKVLVKVLSSIVRVEIQPEDANTHEMIILKQTAQKIKQNFQFIEKQKLDLTEISTRYKQTLKN